MRHRLFVALNLPLSLQEEIFCLASRYPELPAKWTRKENLHITLQFLGNASEENIGRISESLKKIAQKHAPFHLTTEAVAYGPSRKNPRMIWITLEESPKLRN
ncbi:MAG: RNA 2',3'-cyclic phosphodiesterase, partial [Candidatus Pacearchaeota archaeon]|nr:RNA 2',3'-cyclic phosphodiesterase [Candidatus Pacearchaeota archaeon]